MFDLSQVPHDTPVDWARWANNGLARLRARKVDHIEIEEPTQLRFCCKWTAIYIQAHIRRGLSLLESGLSELEQGRALVAALCARALLESVALLWQFNQKVLPLLKSRDPEGIDALVFPLALATRRQASLEEVGEEMRAKNILTAIDKMSVEYPNVRPIYDELSEVCHPNSLGVLMHFSDLQNGTFTFDDGEQMNDPAMHYLIFCGMLFAIEEGAISLVQQEIDAILNDPSS